MRYKFLIILFTSIFFFSSSCFAQYYYTAGRLDKITSKTKLSRSCSYRLRLKTKDHYVRGLDGIPKRETSYRYFNINSFSVRNGRISTLQAPVSVEDLDIIHYAGFVADSLNPQVLPFIDEDHRTFSIEELESSLKNAKIKAVYSGFEISIPSKETNGETSSRITLNAGGHGSELMDSSKFYLEKSCRSRSRGR